MREIALDTETTGLDVAHNHRLIEIGCVELVDGRRSGKFFHTYVNPTRSVSAEATKVHGLKEDFLRRQPRFEKIAEAFLTFIKDAQLVIHNAEFDLSFLNAELTRIEQPTLSNPVVDSLWLARKKFPNQSNALDALCQRFGIDLSQRAKHGALVDAGLLAEVYIALKAGDQASFALPTQKLETAPSAIAPPPRPLPPPPIVARKASEMAAPTPPCHRLSQKEIAAHQRFIEQSLSGKNHLWRQFSDITEM